MDGQRTDRDDREQRIREMAHRIWEDEGRPPGQEKRHWEMAESLIDVDQKRVGSETTPEPAEAPADAARTGTDMGAVPAQAKPRSRSRTAAAPAKTSRKSKRE